MTDTETVTEGNGNVFKDLGFDRPQEEQAKACLIREIRTTKRPKSRLESRMAVTAV